MKKSLFVRLVKYPFKKLEFLYSQFLFIIRIYRKKGTGIAFLFGSPGHSNMGDQAQTYCIEKWINKYYPNHYLFILTYSDASNTLVSYIRKIINKNDLLFFHSGYHLTHLYREKEVYCNVAIKFPDFNILVFPQTINFINNKNIESYVSNIFNHHHNITLLCRDDESYKTAQRVFSSCKLLKFPDIVTSLIGAYKFHNNRDGVLFCMRNDIEAHYRVEDIDNFMNKFININTRKTDTTLDISFKKIQKKRETILMDIFSEYSKYKLIITDRYHGTIFSLISGTPVIVLSSTDHKLKSGVKWFPESFSKYVFYADSIDTAYDIANTILKDDEYSYSLPSYFEDNYYSKLIEQI